jgi:hypothetical protein
MEATTLPDGTTEYDDEAFWLRWQVGTLTVDQVEIAPWQVLRVTGEFISPYRDESGRRIFEGWFVALVVDSPENRAKLDFG